MMPEPAWKNAVKLIEEEVAFRKKEDSKFLRPGPASVVELDPVGLEGARISSDVTSKI